MSKKKNNKTGKVWVEKRYRNKLGRWISLKDQEAVVQFYKKNIPEEKRPNDLRAEVKKLDLMSLKNIIDLGNEMFIEGPQLYLVDGFKDNFLDITTKERISLGKRDGSKFFIKNKEVTARELQDELQEYSNKIKIETAKLGERWYKTLVYLEYDRTNNKLVWNLKRDGSEIVRGIPNDKRKK
jgi:hypothetical protein